MQNKNIETLDKPLKVKQHQNTSSKKCKNMETQSPINPLSSPR